MARAMVRDHKGDGWPWPERWFVIAQATTGHGPCYGCPSPFARSGIASSRARFREVPAWVPALSYLSFAGSASSPAYPLKRRRAALPGLAAWVRSGAEAARRRSERGAVGGGNTASQGRVDCSETAAGDRVTLAKGAAVMQGSAGQWTARRPR